MSFICFRLLASSRTVFWHCSWSDRSTSNLELHDLNWRSCKTLCLASSSFFTSYIRLRLSLLPAASPRAYFSSYEFVCITWWCSN